MSDELEIWVFAETEGAIASLGVDGARVSEDTGGSFSPSPNRVAEGVKGLLKKKRVPLDAQALKSQMNGLMQVVGDLFRQSEHQTGMHLEEVSLTVEINAEGQIGIVGNGGKLGNSGGIAMKFTRPPQS